MYFQNISSNIYSFKLLNNIWRQNFGVKLPKLRGNTLSELFQLRVSPDKLADLPTAAGAVTSSCTGSGFSLRISPLEDIGGAELDLDTAG